MTGRRVDYEDHSMHGAQSWRDYFKVNTDHKVIGTQYLVIVFFFFVIGGIFAELVRTELATPGQTIGNRQTYNGLFSVHATLMIFLFVIPAFAGLANYVLPIMIGAKDMAFPRLNALSVWMLIPGGLMMAVSPLFGAFATGWTAYVAARHPGRHRHDAVRGRRPVRRRELDRHGDQLPGHDLHHARPGHDRVAHAAAGLGQRHDVGAGGLRHAVHRRLAVHDALRPRHGDELLRPAPRAAT